jgi:hypothetical protein
MPNLHGMHPDGVRFAGVARIIRHCTSLSKPDGPDGNRVGEGRHRNHLYGTFTAAKEGVVNAGRILSARALQSKPPPQASGDCSDDDGNFLTTIVRLLAEKGEGGCVAKRREEGGVAPIVQCWRLPGMKACLSLHVSLHARMNTV